jgi:integrase
MAGKIRTREVCPTCGKKFRIVEESDIFCPQCNTRPSTYYIFLYWSDPLLGRDHRITRDLDGQILDSYRRTHRLLERIRSEIDQGIFTLTNYLPNEVNQFRGDKLFPEWLDYIKTKSRALSYLRNVEQYIEDHFVPQLGSLNMQAPIKTYHIEAFRKYLVTVYRQANGSPLAPKSVKNVMDQLKSFCNWLYRREIIPRIPVFDPVDVPENLITVMPVQDREKVLRAITSPHLRNILTFMSRHPIRPSEAAALDVRHFDLSGMAVKIENGLDRDRSIKTRKSRRAYEIPLSALWDHTCIKGRFGKEIAFPNKDGARYTDHTLNDAWKRACKRAKIEYVSLYPAMRHTTATGYALQGASEEQIEAMLGQSTKGMSRKYVKRSIEMVRHLVNVK